MKETTMTVPILGPGEQGSMPTVGGVPSSEKQILDGATAALAAGDSTTFTTMDDLRKKNQKLYKAMMQSAAWSLIHGCQQSNDRIHEMNKRSQSGTA